MFLSAKIFNMAIEEKISNMLKISNCAFATIRMIIILTIYRNFVNKKTIFC